MTDPDDEDSTIAEIRAYQRGRLIRSTPVRRATMTDTPKHIFDPREEHLAACDECLATHRWLHEKHIGHGTASVVADSPELAQARTRIAALWAEAAQARADADASLARVRELEAERERLAKCMEVAGLRWYGRRSSTAD